ncbi:hypothetical protein HHK36_003693 [Tetracentron sinense]|uniref:E2 ubiquitin-conjugating enzyme n=1 Tax=Tetracentron sinense TaxID=13715 RepID=A0A834ZSY5_TETSI|nr:hypothetical protein HHK36_003693 [Tetracentron sinense]
MESPELAINFAGKSKKHEFSGSSSSIMDPEVDTTPGTSPNSSSKKLKQNEVITVSHVCGDWRDQRHVEVGSHEVMEIDTDEDPAGVLISSEKIDTANDRRATNKVYDNNWQNQVEDPLANGLLVPTSASDLGSADGDHSLKNLATGTNNLAGVSSDLVFYDNDGDDEDAGDNDDDVYDDYINDFAYDDEYSSLQAQFDTVDLPPGVEAYVPWMQDPGQSKKKSAAASSSTSIFQSLHDPVPIPYGVEVSSPWFQDPSKSQQNPDATSSSIVSVESCSNDKEEYEEDEEALKKFLLFKQFDTVQDYLDHHFTDGGSSMKQPSKNWSKKIQEEWKILEKDLPPDTIFVRVYEARMDLLRAVIVGAAGTPYHDGLFFFDVFFPPDYPNVPPQVYYYSGGLRLNPNLYECGKVCLSLLNTWNGNRDEMWIPKRSTMLQVLVSIQALILNAQPFFNEPGYEMTHGTPEGERNSMQYNESTFILSLRTMLYTLRRPPKHFEYFVRGHFRRHAHDILGACKAYMEGAQVGCLTEERVQGIDEAGHSPSDFKKEIVKMAKKLVVAFTKNGAKDCEQFLPPAENGSERSDTTLRL